MNAFYIAFLRSESIQLCGFLHVNDFSESGVLAFLIF